MVCSDSEGQWEYTVSPFFQGNHQSQQLLFMGGVPLLFLSHDLGQEGHWLQPSSVILHQDSPDSDCPPLPRGICSDLNPLGGVKDDQALA